MSFSRGGETIGGNARSCLGSLGALLPLRGSNHAAAAVVLPQKSVFNLRVDLVKPLLRAVGLWSARRLSLWRRPIFSTGLSPVGPFCLRVWRVSHTERPP